MSRLQAPAPSTVSFWPFYLVSAALVAFAAGLGYLVVSSGRVPWHLLLVLLVAPLVVRMRSAVRTETANIWATQQPLFQATAPDAVGPIGIREVISLRTAHRANRGKVEMAERPQKAIGVTRTQLTIATAYSKAGRGLARETVHSVKIPMILPGLFALAVTTHDGTRYRWLLTSGSSRPARRLLRDTGWR